MQEKDIGVSTETRTPAEAEGPLRRWARRKREAALEEKAFHSRRETVPAEGLENGEPSDDASEPAVVEETVLTDDDMPPLESLDENSDFSGFLSSGVSEGLRRRALRKLFLSAAFNVRDGLDDYDDDFTSFEALGDIVTSDMKHQAEMEAERARQARAETEPAAARADESARAADERPARAGDEPTQSAEEDRVEDEEPRDSPALAGRVSYVPMTVDDSDEAPQAEVNDRSREEPVTSRTDESGGDGTSRLAPAASETTCPDEDAPSERMAAREPTVLANRIPPASVAHDDFTERAELSGRLAIAACGSVDPVVGDRASKVAETDDAFRTGGRTSGGPAEDAESVRTIRRAQNGLPIPTTDDRESIGPDALGSTGEADRGDT